MMFRSTVRKTLAVLTLAGLAQTAFAQGDSFEKATIPSPAIPPSAPVDEAAAAAALKKTAAVKKQVEKLWDGIVFEKDGKPVNYLVTLDTDVGPIEIELFPKAAPNHVRSFIALSKAGFYDGLIFHRCIPGFVIQGGCPVGQGFGGPGYHLKAEFNSIKHERGILSMARARDPDSAGSQFFVCVAPAPSLNNQYTVFGKVVKGMDAVDKIVEAPTGPGDRPNRPVHIKKATVETR